MNMNVQRITQTIGRTTVQAKLNSPHIFFGLGIAGMITSTALACRATLKLEKELDQMRLDRDSIRAEADDLLAIEGNGYTRADHARDLGGVYIRNSLKIARYYAPTIIIASASVACLSGAHVQLTRRNAALSGTLALLGQSFEEYRERVRKELGEEKELELYHNPQCLEDQALALEKGRILNPDAPIGYSTSPWAACFDQRSTEWKPSVEANEAFLRMMQWQANQRLTAYGIVFLNEVRESLGLPKTDAGQIYGWVKNNPDPMSDGQIDFGIYRVPQDTKTKIPWNRAIWLDFNVDGPVSHFLDRAGSS